MKGFRTIYASFHHFAPPQASKFSFANRTAKPKIFSLTLFCKAQILQDAVKSGEGIAIFELCERSVESILIMFSLFVVAIIATLLFLPFSLKRALWTFVFPIVPAVLVFDGLVSALRAYSRDELMHLARRADPQNKFKWEFKRLRSFPIPCTMFIGTPRDIKRSDH